MATVGKTTDRMPPGNYSKYRSMKKHRETGSVRNNIEGKEEKREEEKKQGTPHYPLSCRKCGYSGGETTDRMSPGNYSTYRSMNTDIEEKEGTGT